MIQAVFLVGKLSENPSAFMAVRDASASTAADAAVLGTAMHRFVHCHLPGLFPGGARLLSDTKLTALSLPTPVAKPYPALALTANPVAV
jgi:hypothetical protein